MAARRFASLVLFALLAIASVTSAEASATPLVPRIDGVRIADAADGRLVSVTLHGRPRPRLLRPVEHLVAIAIADVDADGDLDILASTSRPSLLLWRNAGRGHFVLARLPKARDSLGCAPRLSHGTRATSADEPGEACAGSAIPDIERGGNPLVVRSFLLSESYFPIAQYRVAPTGRAPPFLD